MDAESALCATIAFMSMGELAPLVASSGFAGVAAVVGVPAARALSRIILGIGDIGTAYVERPAKRIRAKTDRIVEKDKADALVEDQKASAAALLTGADADGGREARAAVRITAQEDRKQANREAVAALAYDSLAADPPKGDEPVSDDFLNAFERVAEDASSEDLRQLFAKLLAGECRAPGSHSRSAIHFMSLMDGKLAQEIETWAGFVSGPAEIQLIPAGPPFDKGHRLLSMRRLEAVGLVLTGIHTDISLQAGMFFEGQVIYGNGQSTNKPAVAYLTPLGVEVFGLVRRRLTKDEIDDLKTYLGHYGFSEFQTSTTFRSDGKLFKINLKKPL